MSAFRDLSGLWFGRWKIIAPAYRSVRDGGWFWHVQCQCPAKTTRTAPSGKLTSYHSQSCGCLRSDVTSRRNRSHGLSQSPEYKIWMSMKQRCNNKKSPDYPNYGERGIRVCKRWSGPKGFTLFILDMGRKPTPTSSIERRNNNGNYTPKNCFWLEKGLQPRNRRITKRLTVDGVTKTVCEWAEEYGIPQKVLYCRVVRSGWDFKVAVTIPVESLLLDVCYRGRKCKTAELVSVAGVPTDTITQRLRSGWTPERAVETPVAPRTKRTVRWRGREWKFSALAKHVGINHHVLRRRVLVLKWSVSRATTTPVNRIARRRQSTTAVR